MDVNSPDAKSYLNQLYQSTGGKPDAQVSMFEVGAAIGLEKEAAGKIAENLIGTGLIEVKTLSGGIGITAQGIEVVQADGGVSTASSDDLTLNSGPLLDESGRQAMDAILSELRSCIAASSSEYGQLEEMVIDMKTIEVQLLSPKPKTAICRETLYSLQAAFKGAGVNDMARRLGQMTGRENR